MNLIARAEYGQVTHEPVTTITLTCDIAHTDRDTRNRQSHSVVTVFGTEYSGWGRQIKPQLTGAVWSDIGE